MTLLVTKSRSTCRVHLVTSVVSFSRCQFVKFPRDVLGCARICILISVNPVGVDDEIGLLLFFVILLISVPTGLCAAGMKLVAYLALGIVSLMLLLMLLWWGLSLTLLPPPPRAGEGEARSRPGPLFPLQLSRGTARVLCT